MEFLASLTPPAKAKISSIKAPNKAVVYADQVLGEEDVSRSYDPHDDVS